MAILSRVKISPQQRFDLEDYTAEQSSARSDSKLWVQKFLSDTNLILGGFTVSGIGLNSALIAMSNAALIIPQNTSDFSYFISAPVEPDVTLTDADLVDGVRNYVELELTTEDGTPLTKAFWDPGANSGNGAEFNQIVDTIVDLKANFVVSTGGFSGSPDRLPICIIDTDGSGIIKVILDRRELFGRLAKPNDLDNQYTWGTKEEPVYQLNMTGVVGVFTAGEIITIGGETATVVAGGGASITFNEPTGINFGNGDSVVGSDSGATGTVNTVFETFLGVDKSLNNQKEINDALMTELKLLKGTRFWWQTAPSTSGIKNEILSIISPISSGAKVKWNGSELVITDDSLTPSDTDDVAAIRLFNSTVDLFLTRQDDGKEVVTITLSDVPDEGILTLDQDGNLIAINWDDSASDIQTTWDGSGAYAATISGSPAAKKIVITANAAGAEVDVIEDSNTFENSTIPVVATITVKQGMAVDGSIAIGDGQILYVDIPEPLANTDYSGVGVSAANYKVVDRGDAALQDPVYWLAYREGSKLMWRFGGELQSGESSEISDNVPQTLLDSIGLATEASLPSYSSDIRGVSQESLVKRIGTLTDAMGDYQEDRSGYLRSDDPVTWTGSQLQFSSDLILELINTKTGVLSQHIVDTGDSPISLANLESAWILIDRDQASEVCVLRQTSIDAIPAQMQANKDVFILFRRQDVSGSGYLHIPFHKQVMDPNQTVRLGASGSGSGGDTVRVDLYDPLSTTLPVGVSAVIDGITVTDGMLVLFSNLTVGSDRIYEVSGVGVSLVWTAQSMWSTGLDPVLGDSVLVTQGLGFGLSTGLFDGTDFKFNDVVRFFNGVDYWELSSLQTQSLLASTTDDVFSIQMVGSENIIVDYSIIRGAIKETGTIHITTDGTDVAVTTTGAYIGTSGVSFSGDINLGDLRLRYTADGSGGTATMKFFVRRWSDAAGGPAGVPSYSSVVSGVTAAGADTQIQFNDLGNLGADADFTWDKTNNVLKIKDLELTGVRGPVTLNDNEASPQTIFTYDASDYPFVIIEFSCIRDGIYQIGRIMITNNGADIGFSEDSVPTDIMGLGITFSAVIVGTDVVLQYTSTNTGFAASFKYTMRRWA